MATVLYVDDEETISRLVARWFGRRGDDVLLGRDIESARQLLVQPETIPDVIFIDVWLGRESGVDLLAWIERERPDLARRVTFVTGELPDDVDDKSDRGTAARGRPVIHKPFEMSALARYVDAAVAGAKGRSTT